MQFTFKRIYGEHKSLTMRNGKFYIVSDVCGKEYKTQISDKTFFYVCLASLNRKMGLSRFVKFCSNFDLHLFDVKDDPLKYIVEAAIELNEKFFNLELLITPDLDFTINQRLFIDETIIDLMPKT